MALVLKKDIMKRILTALFLSLPSLFLSAQAQMIHERMYLSTDKECYLAGEPVWISAFCYDATTGIPSPVSAVAFIELQDFTGSPVQAKIALDRGRGNGMMELPLSLPTGVYRLTAYTRYMYSESNLNYFTRFVTVYNPLTSLRLDNVTTVSETDTLPEPTAFHETTEGLDVMTDRKVYRSGEQIGITLRNRIPEDVSAAVSVYRKDDLNHYVNPSVRQVVDSTRKEKTSPFPLWRVDYPGEVIRGHIVDENNEPVVNGVESFGSYISIAGSDIQYFTGEIRDNGTVRFFTSNLYGNGTLISYVPSFNHKKYHLVLDSVYMHPAVTELPSLVLDRKQQDVLVERSTGVQMSKAFSLDTLFREEGSRSNLLFRDAGIVYDLDEYTRFPSMGEVLVEFIREARFRTVNGVRTLQVRLRDVSGVAYYMEDSTPPLVLLDGIPVEDHEKIYAYDPNLVKEIVIYPDQYAFGPIYYNGILFIKTYRGDFPNLDLEESMRVQEFVGVQNPRSFGTVARGSRLPDLRHTLYWNPLVELSENDSVTLKATTSENTGLFVVVAEGMSRTGKPFRSTVEFMVR